MFLDATLTPPRNFIFELRGKDSNLHPFFIIEVTHFISIRNNVGKQSLREHNPFGYSMGVEPITYWIAVNRSTIELRSNSLFSIPNISISKNNFTARMKGFEPLSTVLETVVLPIELHSYFLTLL